MAKIAEKRFAPTPEQLKQGMVPMTKEEIINALSAYAVQNPKKFEAKKAELFKRYGIDDVVAKDETPVELVEAKKAVKKNAK